MAQEEAVAQVEEESSFTMTVMQCSRYSWGGMSCELLSGGSRILERGVPVRGESARSAPARGAWGHAPQENFIIFAIVSGVLLG